MQIIEILQSKKSILKQLIVIFLFMMIFGCIDNQNSALEIELVNQILDNKIDANTFSTNKMKIVRTLNVNYEEIQISGNIDGISKELLNTIKPKSKGSNDSFVYTLRNGKTIWFMIHLKKSIVDTSLAGNSDAEFIKNIFVIREN